MATLTQTQIDVLQENLDNGDVAALYSNLGSYVATIKLHNTADTNNLHLTA